MCNCTSAGGRRYLAPVAVPLILHLPWARTAGFRVVSGLGIRYRRSPAIRREPFSSRYLLRAGQRLPNARVPRDGVACWLHEPLVPVGFHLLLCGPADSWDEGALEVVRERYGHLMTIHRLTRDGLPGMLQDEDGRALARLGAGRRGVRHYLVRPDGYVAFGSKAADFRGLQAQLPCWLAVPGRY